MENLKKPVVIGIGALIIIAAVATVLGSGLFEAGNLSINKVGVESGVMPSGRSLGIPAIKNNLDNQGSIGEPVPTDATTINTVDKKVTKNGNLDLKVSSVDKAAGDIAKIAKDNGGDIFSANVYNFSLPKSGAIQVRVPVANFEKTLSDIKKIAALVIQESTSSQDVTEEYVDLQAQLKNKQAEEQQYLEILKQAQKISDILEVTQQLSQVRGEIEQLQGQLKFLNSQTDMASISISLSEDQNITITDSWRPWQVVKDAVNSLLKKGQGFVNFVIVLIITVIPVAILYLLLAYVIYLIGRKIYTKFKKQ